MKTNYFSNVLIGQYFVTKIPLKVFVDSEYLRIVEYSDIEYPDYGYGMRENGEMVPFDYRMVDHLIVGDNIIDLDTATAESENEPKEKPIPDEKGAGDEPEPEPEAKPAAKGAGEKPAIKK